MAAMADIGDEERLSLTTKELKGLQKQQDDMRLENTMLSEHLTRVVARKGSLQLHLEKMDSSDEDSDTEPALVSPTVPVAMPVSAMSSRRKSTRKSVRVFHDGPANLGKPTVRFRAPPPKSTKSGSPLPLSVEEKVEIVEEECESLRETMERIKADNQRVLDDLRAVFNQACYSLSQTREEKNSLYREVLMLSTINPARKLPAEEILGYLRDKMRKKRNVRDKLQEKIDLLHMGIMEAEHNFSTKTDIKELLHVIDFDQLNIQNIQLTARIRERSREVWHIKGCTKKALKLLDRTRGRLNDAIKTGLRTKTCLKDRSPRVESMKDNIVDEKKRHGKLNNTLKVILQDEDNAGKPRALDYMRSRVQCAALLRELKTWKNKVEIAEHARSELLKLAPPELRNSMESHHPVLVS